MDLPTCPSCGQSVLDDDVDECPFCGESMSAKPGARKKAAGGKKDATNRKATPADTKKRKKTVAAAADEGDEDDDPFSMDGVATKKAVPTVPKPTKGRLFKVTCPMCETVGFLPKKAAGREVKCHNTECPLPVFTAPESTAKKKKKQAAAEAAKAAEEEAATAAKKQARRMPIIIGVTIVVMAIVGVGAVMMNTGEEANTGPTFDPINIVNDDDSQEGDTGDTGGALGATNGSDSSEPVATEPEVVEPLTLIQDMIVTARHEKNRDKPWSRRLTADSFVRAGKFEDAQAELDHMIKIGRDRSHYSIEPLVHMAWQRLEAGDRESAGIAVKAATQRAQRLPTFGRVPLDSAIALAAILTATGSMNDARSLVRDQTRDYSDEPNLAEARLAAEVVILREFATLGFAPPKIEPVHPWTDPLRTAVAVVLAAHGRWDEAVEWASTAPTPLSRSDVLAACVRLVSADSGAIATVTSAAGELAGPEKARVLAAIATRVAEDGNSDEASKLVGQATSILEAVTLPSPVTVPALAEMLEFTLPNPESATLAAVAAVETACAQSKSGNTAAATDSLQLAIQFARGIAPSLASSEEASRAARAKSMRGRLADELGLESDDMITRTLRRYRGKCEQLRSASRQRLELLDDLFTAAVRNGMSDVVLDVITSAAGADADPFSRSNLPWVLQEVRGNSGEGLSGLADGDVPDGEQKVRLAALQRIKDGRYSQAAKAIEAPGIDSSYRERLGLRLALELVEAGEFRNALKLCRSFENPLWRETQIDLIAGRALKTQDAAVVRDTIISANLPPAETVSAFHGFVLQLLNGLSDK